MNQAYFSQHPPNIPMTSTSGWNLSKSPCLLWHLAFPKASSRVQVEAAHFWRPIWHKIFQGLDASNPSGRNSHPHVHQQKLKIKNNFRLCVSTLYESMARRLQFQDSPDLSLELQKARVIRIPKRPSLWSQWSSSSSSTYHLSGKQQNQKKADLPGKSPTKKLVGKNQPILLQSCYFSYEKKTWVTKKQKKNGVSGSEQNNHPAPPWAQSCDVLAAQKRHSHLPKTNRGWFSWWSSTSSLNSKKNI